MSLPETVMLELKSLTPEAQRQVLDFTLFLKEKQQRELEMMMNDMTATSVSAPLCFCSS